MTNVKSITNKRYSAAISERERRILLSLSTYKLEADHIRKLLGYQPTSLMYVQERLRELTRSGHLLRERRWGMSPTGSGPYLYALSRRGFGWLQRHDLTEQRRYRNRLGVELDLHSAMVREVLVSALQLPSMDSRTQLDEVLTESELWGMRLRALVVDDQQQGVLRYRRLRPDLFLRFSHHAATGDRRRIETPVWIECERTRGRFRNSWRQKLNGIVAYLEGGEYQRQFGPFFPVVAVVVADADRLPVLKRWTEEFLADRDPKWGRLFLFTSASPKTTPPVQFWKAPLWLPVLHDEPSPLLDEHGVIRFVKHKTGVRMN
jgi:hypothetical protein